MFTKFATALKISLLIIALAFLYSCASTEQPIYRSSVPAHCSFQPYKKPAAKRKAQAPPSSVTPIGGNYKIRN